MYSYAPRPTCSLQNLAGCGSPYLWCDPRADLSRGVSGPHCVSKIKMSGSCAGFEGYDACYNGVCIASYCRQGQFAGAPTQAPSTLLPTLPPPAAQLPQRLVNKVYFIN